MKREQSSLEVMSSLDSAFLRMESPTISLGIASVAIFEGPAPAYDDLVRLFESKLPVLPRYRQRVREVPLWLGRPVWVDDATIDVKAHLRHTALPSPGGPDELRALMGRVMSHPLDRSRPLWEDWVVEGLQGGRWALISKVHHCMVDGIAGTNLLTKVLSTEPFSGDQIDMSPALAPTSEPNGMRLLATAFTTLPEHLLTMVARTAAGVVTHPRRATHDAKLLARGALEWTQLAVPAKPSSLSGPLGKARAWDYTHTTFDDIRAVRTAHGGSFNDVVLAVITRGFRDLLIARGEAPDDHAMRTLIPVSVRKADAMGRVDNEVSAMIIELPVHESDPLARLAAVSLEMDRCKDSGQVEVAELLTEAGGWTSPLLLSIGLTGASRLPQRQLVTVATNVPGPREVLYAFDRRLLALYPYVPIASRVRIGVAMMSYDRVLTFGITADAVSTPDIAVLTAGISQGMRELVDASSGAAAGAQQAAGRTKLATPGRT